MTLVAASAALALGCGAEPEEPSPRLTAEAGFLTIEPVDYAIRGPSSAMVVTSSEARLFYAFHPADEAPEDRPLVVLYNGGPGASTAILLGGNTAPLTLDPARTGDRSSAPSATSWTSFANLLHVDARGAGFSYGVAPGAADRAVREAELTSRNFNPYLDAADVVRVVLRFLGSHPALLRSRVVLAGESYGGLRTEIALHLLLHPDRYEQSDSIYADPALTQEIRAHFDAAGTSAREQLDRAVFLQPRLTSPEQQAAAGASLEAPGSPLYDLDPDHPYVPCADKGGPCSPFANVVDYLATIGRDLYDLRNPAGDELSRYATIGARLADPSVLPDVLGVDLHGIRGLSPDARAGAYRLLDPDPTSEPLEATLGDLPDHDRYFEVELFDLLGAPFVSAELKALTVERTNRRYGRLFLEDLLDVRALVTNASYDAAIWTPSLPEALAMYTSDVQSVHKGDESLTIDYAPGAFGAGQGASRTIVFPTYAASGHSIALDEPEKLAADVRAFVTSE